MIMRLNVCDYFRIRIWLSLLFLEIIGNKKVLKFFLHIYVLNVIVLHNILFSLF